MKGQLADLMLKNDKLKDKRCHKVQVQIQMTNGCYWWLPSVVKVNSHDVCPSV